jgi:hypothetical protein
MPALGGPGMDPFDSRSYRRATLRSGVMDQTTVEIWALEGVRVSS